MSDHYPPEPVAIPSFDPSTSTPVNPLLAKLKIPGRMFQLPSKGVFYNDGELSAEINDAEIHIQPMNAFDEIILKNPDMLFSGKALDPVFSNCIAGIQKPTKLFGKDVDAIMLYLRLVTYGPSYEIVATHNCENAMQHSYVADLEKVLSKMKYIDPTVLADQFTIDLPNGQHIVLHPARYDKIIEVLQANEGKKNLSVEDMQRNIHLNLLSIIHSIDGISDQALISEWIHVAPANFIEKIAQRLESLNDWGLDLQIEFTCKDCGQPYKVELPINPVSFFA